MLVAFPGIFVANTKATFNCNLAAPLIAFGSK